MGEVTGFTAERTQQIENQSIVIGEVVDDDLIFYRLNGTSFNAGEVRGPIGPAGPPGGLGEAPSNGLIHGRKDGAWMAVPSSILEAPIDGKAYARQNGAWIIAPGSLLDEVYNDTDALTGLNTPVSFGGSGTNLVVPVGSRGVTVDFESVLGHSQDQKLLATLLYVDGVLHARGQPFQQLVLASGICSPGKKVTFSPGELSVGSHTFEIKARQANADAYMSMYTSWISVRAN